ncbi:hypothetical protein ACWD26_13010 [Streptomyces sp. NPDC002787]
MDAADSVRLVPLPCQTLEERHPSGAALFAMLVSETGAAMWGSRRLKKSVTSSSSTGFSPGPQLSEHATENAEHAYRAEERGPAYLLRLGELTGLTLRLWVVLGEGSEVGDGVGDDVEKVLDLLDTSPSVRVCSAFLPIRPPAPATTARVMSATCLAPMKSGSEP